MLFPVRDLLENKNKLLCVSKSTLVREALSLMVAHDYSQLPVTDLEGNLVGMVSETSIIRTYYHIDTKISLLDLPVDHCMSPAPTISPNSDIFEALDILKNVYAVMVIENQKPFGILTDYDTTHFFRDISEGLILVEDIELSLRRYIKNILNNDHKMDAGLHNAFGTDRRDTSRPAKEYDKLTFRDHIQFITSEGNWGKFSFYFNPKDFFGTLMCQVGDIRNQLAHFRGKLEPIQLNALIRAKEWLEARPKFEVKLKGESSVSHHISSNGEVVEVLVGDYEPLTKWFDKHRKEGRTSRFLLEISQIEEILGWKLPETARRHSSWWENDYLSNPHSKAWIAAGWLVEDVDITKENVIFKQTNDALYQMFFADLLKLLKISRPGITQSKKASLANWFSFSAGVSGFAFGWALPRESILRVELYIDTSDKECNKKTFERLKEQRDEIEAEIGEKLIWDRLKDARACRIYASIPFRITQTEEEHEKAKQWGLDMMLRFIDAFQPRLRKI